MNSSRLDLQFDHFKIPYTLLGPGLPRAPYPAPTIPALVRINGEATLCLLSKASILRPEGPPRGIERLEVVSDERQQALLRSLNLTQMTVLCRKANLLIDRKLRLLPSITLPVGDGLHYLEVDLKHVCEMCTRGDNSVQDATFETLDDLDDLIISRSEFTQSLLNRNIQALETLPPFPATARAIIQMSLEEEIDIAELERVLELDAPIVSRLLGWANSAGVHQGRPITSIKQAIMVLGTRCIMGYALQSSMMKSFKPMKEVSLLVQSATFNSLHTAYGSRKISPGGDHDVYHAGLMHTLGDLMMAHTLPRQALTYLKLQQMNPHIHKELLALDVFKVSFAHATLQVMEHWKLSTKAIEAVRDLMTFADQGKNEIAHCLRVWQTMMLDAGVMPYHHAPPGWETIPSNPLGADYAQKEQTQLSKFHRFASNVSQGISS